MANSKRKCAFCGDYGKSEDGYIHQNSYYCNHDHFVENAIKNRGKLAKKGRLIERRILNERKKAIRTLKWHKERAKNAVCAWVRYRDRNLPCCSCGRPNDGKHERHGSHYRSVGACSSLMFDEMNIHASCSQCNTHKSGNISEYTPVLIERIGQAEFERIVSAPKLKKLTKEEVDEIYNTYKEKLKKAKATDC